MLKCGESRESSYLGGVRLRWQLSANPINKTCLEKQYGVNIALGTISFNENELRAKMTARVGNAVPSMSRNDFNVGNIVTINHKKVNPNDQFTILKINSKNIKVEKIVDGGLVGAIINV